MRAQQNARLAHRSAEKERTAHNEADKNAERADHTAYSANMNLIQRDWDMNNVGHVLDLLEATRQYKEREFEWGYWNRLCHLDLKTFKILSQKPGNEHF